MGDRQVITLSPDDPLAREIRLATHGGDNVSMRVFSTDDRGRVSGLATLTLASWTKVDACNHAPATLATEWIDVSGEALEQFISGGRMIEPPAKTEEVR